MMEWTLHGYTGQDSVLPEPVAWRLEYGLGSPCDSFWVKILWKAGQEDLLADGVRLTVTEGGKPLFTGIVDECECQWSEEGCTAELSGRGMQGLLLDNQAEAADYGQATIADILRNYVTPYGIKLAGPADLPPVWGFSVASGSSCWKVLHQFARYYAGVTPRFDRAGQLMLTPWTETVSVRLDEKTPITRLMLRERRYGVLSQVTVKDTTGWSRQVEENTAFKTRGGQCSRVLLLPRDTGYQARRYRARFQLKESMAQLRQIQVTVALPFAAWPGELVELTRAGWCRNGVYRVRESRVSLGEGGCRTTLVLEETM